MRVILCGYHWAGCKSLKLLLNERHEIFVYTHDSPYYIPSLKNMCINNNIGYTTANISDSKLPFIPDVICSIYYRNIIKKNIIDICNGRIFNLHPSLLPKYRGCSSLTWAMINGEKEAGFTYHYIDESCDTGNILLQKQIAIEEWDTQETLYNRVQFMALDYFNEVLGMVVSGIQGSPQTGESSYYKRGCPFNGEIDSSWDNSYIERFIRAMIYPPYPPAKYKKENVVSLLDYSKLTKKDN